MNAVGFDWDGLVRTWEENYKKLLMFKRRYGHCNVSHSGKEQAPCFLVAQPSELLKYLNRLSPECIRRLDAIGLIWTPKNSSMGRVYRRLVAVPIGAGHCNVPHRWVQKESPGGLGS